MVSNPEPNAESVDGNEDVRGASGEGPDSDTPEVTETSINIPMPQLSSLADMGVVGIREGIAYGFGLMVYIVGLALIAGVLGMIATALAGAASGLDNLLFTLVVGLIAFVFGLIAFIALAAGFAGLQYKIIADAVSVGTNDSS
jgi:hypothetical protein